MVIVRFSDTVFSDKEVESGIREESSSKKEIPPKLQIINTQQPTPKTTKITLSMKANIFLLMSQLPPNNPNLV